MRVGAFFLVATSASALALRAGPHIRRPPPRRATACSCTAPAPPEGEGGDPPEATPSYAREALERAIAIDAEVLRSCEAFFEKQKILTGLALGSAACTLALATGVVRPWGGCFHGKAA